VPGALSAIDQSAEGLARALRRLYADRGLSIDVRVPADLPVRVQREDLDEMVGNLLDNACKWGRTRVAVEARRAEDAVEVTVDDDGSGLPNDMREAVLVRGVRADEAAPGSGLFLEASPLGGLRARLTLPYGGA
jgi:signal transduction histidine kinase